MLSENALEALASLMEGVEAMGTWPSQVRLITMPLLSKAKSGHRVIGILLAVQRLWAKARRKAAVDWEQQTFRSYFAGPQGIAR